MRLRVLLLGQGPRLAEAAAELEPALTGIARVVTASEAETRDGATPLGETTAVLLLLADREVGSLDQRILALDEDPDLAAACLVILTDQDQHNDLGATLDRDRLAALFTVPWPPGELARQVRSQLARWLRARDPADDDLQRLDAGGRALELPASELLHDLEVSEADVTTRLVDAIERALGPRPRLSVAKGTRLTVEGRSVDGVVVLLRGSVALERETRLGPLTLHHGSTGPVIGLLSLAQQRRAFFTARTTTDARVIHLSLEQLDLALATEPEVGAALAAIAITGLARRLRRAEQLQLERIELNRDLEAERAQLAATLEELEATRDELVRQARLASLGELAAGVAHELNNPVSALGRAASFVDTDVRRLLAAHPRGDELEQLITGAQQRSALPTAEERARRRVLAQAVGDERLARLLLNAGIEDGERARELLDRFPDQEELEAVVGLGSALRNLEVAAERVADLVASLRAYARPGQDLIDGVDLNGVVDDALRLVGHRLDQVEIERDYDDLPPIRAHPGELGQVVGNLVINAVEALDGPGTITIRTLQDADEVVVTVTDDGPGIDPAMLARLESPGFTTKQGTVRYGLGLGLGIVRRIIEAHGGRFELRSRPGRTVAEVRLPSGEAT